MPGKARVKGVLKDANNAPIEGGKILATMIGSDAFENGIRLAPRKIGATTDADGMWEVDLIVNREGRDGSTTWSISAYDADLTLIYTVDKLFITSTAEILLDDLSALSRANAAVAAEQSLSRLYYVNSIDDYLALPAKERRPTDMIMLPAGGGN